MKKPAREKTPERLGLFGGSFNPIHLGHLLLAERAADELKLDRVVVIPNPQSPLKSGADIAPPSARLAMVKGGARGYAS
jgi:nicotinate-nucleotide adenylyltransferase